MNAVAEIVTPVFGVMLLGYAASRGGWFDKRATQTLSRFVFVFVIPPLLFRNMALADLPPRPPWAMLASYYGAAIAVAVAAMLLGGLLRRSLSEQGILGFGAAFGNTVLMGIPLVLASFGEDASLPLFLIIGTHSPLLMTLVTGVVEVGRGSRHALGRIPLDTLRGLSRNPVILGLSLGMLFNIAGWPIPAPVDAVAHAMGLAAMPCALFAMGAALSQYRIAGNLLEALVLVVLKLVVHPLLVWLLAARVFQLPELWVKVLVLLAALPIGVNVYLFAERYRVGVATATTAIVIASGLSIITLPLVLLLLGVG